MAEASTMWKIRAKDARFESNEEYDIYNQMFCSLKIVHGGHFTGTPHRFYVTPKVDFINYVNTYHLSYENLRMMAQGLGYEAENLFFYYYKIDETLDVSLIRLENEADFQSFKGIVQESFNTTRCIFIEKEIHTVFTFYPNTLRHAQVGRIEKLIFDFIEDHPRATIQDAIQFVNTNFEVRIPYLKMETVVVKVRAKLDAWGLEGFPI